MTCSEHLQWAKNRAIEYAKTGDLNNAWASMVTDLRKHDELKNHPAIELGMMMLISGNLSTQKAMIDFIEGFN